LIKVSVICPKGLGLFIFAPCPPSRAQARQAGLSENK